MKSASPEVLSGGVSKVIACAAFCGNCLSHLWCGVVVGVTGLVVLTVQLPGGYGEGRTVVRAGAGAAVRTADLKMTWRRH